MLEVYRGGPLEVFVWCNFEFTVFFSKASHSPLPQDRLTICALLKLLGFQLVEAISEHSVVVCFEWKDVLHSLQEYWPAARMWKIST